MTFLSSTARAEAYGPDGYGELQASYGHEDNITCTCKNDELRLLDLSFANSETFSNFSSYEETAE